LTICDVGPRDGLQNEPETLAPAVRAELVSRLAAARVPRVEAVSFVRDDVVPQMAGAEQVVAAVERRDGTELSGLVLNARGYERFASAGLDRVNCTLAATETFNQRNGNATLDGGGRAGSRDRRWRERARHDHRLVCVGVPVRGRGRPGGGRRPL